jgi:hypothetical protein
LKVELTPDAAQWVQAEVAAGRTAEEVVRHAVNQAKLIELCAELAAAEAEGGSFSTDEVRRYANDHLNRLNAHALGASPRLPGSGSPRQIQVIAWGGHEKSHNGCNPQSSNFRPTF